MGAMPQPAGTPDLKSQMTSQLNATLSKVNIAEEMDEEELDKIGDAVYKGYELDLRSMAAWSDQVDEWVKLAAQIKSIKTYPWKDASNVKYPLLSTAAMQFAARAYPSLIPADGKIVQFKVVGQDPQGFKAAKADKLAAHMNYQLLEDMKSWEEEMDRLMIQLPIVGCLFKKTYFDEIKKRNASRLLGPKDLVVNYWASSLEEAYRKTEIIQMNKNQVRSNVVAKVFLDVDLPDPAIDSNIPSKSDAHGAVMPSQVDDTTPYVILEQHTFLDLDDDDYYEPYIVTIEARSKKVLRIVARYDSDGIIVNKDGDVVCIEPVEYYTKYEFIPNPDGGFYGVGFGHLLGPLNESANTLINILIDSGHLATLQAGFIGKGLRMRPGEQKFSPGEWKQVNVTGDDIKKQVFPLPVKEPSEVLFKLLGMIIDSGRELASVAEIFTGKMPGQNTPATTTQATIEQGMKVFTAIYKRTYRALAQEFKKLFRLNSLYEDNFEKARLVLDTEISPQDYDIRSYDVCPTADPTAVSTTQKLMKAQSLLNLLPLGTINPMEVTKRVLEGQEQPNLQALLQQPQPQVDPKVQAMQEKTKMEREKHQMDMQGKQMELQFKQQEALMDQKFMQMEKMMEMKLKEMEFRQAADHQQRQAMLDVSTGQMDMEHSQAQHEQKMTQMKEQNSVRKQGAMDRVAKPSSNRKPKGSNSKSN